mgnify:CR=1 FL=1
MVIVYLNQKRNSKKFPEKYKLEAGFIHKFISLVKYLLLNELEFATLTVLIDNLGWENEIVKEHWDYFCILGIKAKQLMRSEKMSSKLLDKVIKTNPSFMDYYADLVNDENVSKKIEEKINLKTINEAFRKLNHPTNSYCRKTFINYTGIADKIIKLCFLYDFFTQIIITSMLLFEI